MSALPPPLLPGRAFRCGRSATPWLALLALLLGGCVRSERISSGRVFPLMRHTPGDGLAVVTGPGGQGIHIWLDPDTTSPGVCRPRWNPDPARLIGGDGPSPRSGGRAPRQEFYGALLRGKVRLALRQQMAELCRQRAPDRRVLWQPPPRLPTRARPWSRGGAPPCPRAPSTLGSARSLRRAPVHRAPSPSTSRR
jgi:hypothetical protein